jgi:hypothetical protein
MQRGDKNPLTAAGVSAPELVYAQDPEFTSQARTKNVAGNGEQASVGGNYRGD